LWGDVVCRNRFEGGQWIKRRRGWRECGRGERNELVIVRFKVEDVEPIRSAHIGGVENKER